MKNMIPYLVGHSVVNWYTKYNYKHQFYIICDVLCIFDELPIALWITTYTSMGECYIILSWPPGQQIKIATIACVCGLKDQASQGLMLF